MPIRRFMNPCVSRALYKLASRHPPKVRTRSGWQAVKKRQFSQMSGNESAKFAQESQMPSEPNYSLFHNGHPVCTGITYGLIICAGMFSVKTVYGLGRRLVGGS